MPKDNKKEEGTKLLTAKDIYKGLNKTVVGQEDAKKALSVTVFLHLARTLCAVATDRAPFKKSNLMLIGPTGVGKTYLMQTIKKITDIPVFHINAKDLSSPGYVGTSLEDCFSMFVEGIGVPNIETAENSIIFIDEFDKICIHSREEVSGFNKPLQYALLKAIEGNDYQISIGKRDVTFKTDNILFVLGGSFQHLRDKRNKDKKVSKGIGFGANKEEIIEDSLDLHEELVNNGVIRELAGRISIVEELYDLTKSQLRQAFTLKEDSVFKQYQELLKFLGKDFKLSEYKINKIIDKCLATGTGARGLQTALDLYMRDYMFNLKSDIIYEDVLNNYEEEDPDTDTGNSISLSEWVDGLGGYIISYGPPDTQPGTGDDEDE